MYTWLDQHQFWIFLGSLNLYKIQKNRQVPSWFYMVAEQTKSWNTLITRHTSGYFGQAAPFHSDFVEVLWFVLFAKLTNASIFRNFPRLLIFHVSTNLLTPLTFWELDRVSLMSPKETSGSVEKKAFSVFIAIWTLPCCNQMTSVIGPSRSESTFLWKPLSPIGSEVVGSPHPFHNISNARCKTTCFY